MPLVHARQNAALHWPLIRDLSIFIVCIIIVVFAEMF